MANQYKGEVEIEIGGRVRTMRFGFNEMAVLEQRLEGRSILRMMSEGNFGMWPLREALYVGLNRCNPKITPAKVGDWIGEDMSKLGYYGQKIAEALLSFMPKNAAAADPDEGTEAPLAPTQEEPAPPRS